MRLYIVAGKPTDSVTYGFLPAAHRLGLDVTVLTDRPEAHERAYAGLDAGGQAKAAVVGCEVGDVGALIACAAALPAGEALFSNSDHLQAQTALAAEFLSLPGKDWKSALRAKNKALMRRHLAECGVEEVACAEIAPGDDVAALGPPVPAVLKPRDGVASEDVVLARDADELVARCAEVFARRPGEALIAEEYLPGRLRTLETLGDGIQLWVFGGFRTRLSAAPYFIEERLTWEAAPPQEAHRHVLTALDSLGVGFGACHTEFVAGPGGRTRLVEVNDRVIGDQCDLLLADLLHAPLFEAILRVHLGEPLPAEPPTAHGHGVAEYVVADRDGVLADVPSASDATTADGVCLAYRPLRAKGERVAVTHTNRDYLGVIRAVGPDDVGVERAVAAFRAEHRWEVVP